MIQQLSSFCACKWFLLNGLLQQLWGSSAGLSEGRTLRTLQQQYFAVSRDFITRKGQIPSYSGVFTWKPQFHFCCQCTAMQNVLKTKLVLLVQGWFFFFFPFKYCLMKCLTYNSSYINYINKMKKLMSTYKNFMCGIFYFLFLKQEQ